jgi:ribosome maturation factor RimP
MSEQFSLRGVAMSHIDAELYTRLEQLITSMGYELVGCEMQPQGRRFIFRIYIDAATGVGVDDCSKISHQVSAMLDVEDPFDSRYSLEISSPGIDRPLFKLDHYKKFIGNKIKLKLHVPIANQRNFKGVLKRVKDDNLDFIVEGSNEEITVRFDMIEKANLIGEINPVKRETND